MLFAIASYMDVPDPAQAASFLQQRLGFHCQFKEGYGWCAENGSVSLILRQASLPCGVLEVQSPDVEQDAQELLTYPDIHAAGVMEQFDKRQQQRLTADCGITLILSRILTEDDLGELPDLPTQLPWDETTMLHTQRILRIVPLDFRDKARQRVTEQAEYLAVADGKLAVEEAHAMQSLAEVTLDFQHRSLAEAMQEEGIDPTRYLDHAIC